MNHVEEMQTAAKLTEHPDFMGNCAGGFPLIAFEKECRFCGASWNDKCNRSKREAAQGAE